VRWASEAIFITWSHILIPRSQEDPGATCDGIEGSRDLKKAGANTLSLTFFYLFFKNGLKRLNYPQQYPLVQRRFPLFKIPAHEKNT
jgi:hypothetical protein